MSLILPPGMQNQLRPLANIDTEKLLQELQHRQLLAELKGEIKLPADPAMDATARQAMQLEQFTKMAAEIGMAIARSPFAFSGVRQEPSPLNPGSTDDILIMAVCLTMHPELLKRMPAGYTPGPVIDVVPG